MAHYEVDTSHGKVEFDSPRADLSKQEVQDIVNKNHPASSSASINVPEPYKTAAQVITMPGRGTRALGVGIERALPSLRHGQRMGLSYALERATAATKPGYEAIPGEKLGAFAGGLVDPINIAANALLPGGTFLKAMASGALAGAGSNLLDQASTGKINLGEAGITGGLGAAIGGLTHGMSTGAARFLGKSPTLVKATTDVPRRATEVFRDNPGIEKTFAGTEEEIEKHAIDVQKELKMMKDHADAYFEDAVRGVKAKKTPTEMAKEKTIPADKIPDAIEAVKQTMAYTLNKKVNPNLKPDPRMEKARAEIVPTLFKRLLHIRNSISDNVDFVPGVAPKAPGVQGAGLMGLRKDVNALIDQLPGGKKIRSADEMKSAAENIYGKLQTHLETPGRAVKFLRDVFEMKTVDAKEDMANLRVLEKVSGKPIIDDLFKSLSMSHFSQNLAHNKFSRSVAGISPFVFSIIGRELGLPYPAAVTAGVGAASLLSSPKVQGMAIRGAQKFGPAVSKAAAPTATGLLNSIRQRWSDNGNH